jgi:hypothetical protein
MAGTTAGAGGTGGTGGSGGIAGTTAGAGGTGGIAGTTAGAGGTGGTGGRGGTGGTGAGSGGDLQLCGRLGWGSGTGAVIAPGGALFALGNGIRVHLYDWSTRTEIPLAGATPGRMAFSGDGSLFGTAARDGVRVWRTSDGGLVRFTPAMTDAFAFALSSDFSVIAWGDNGFTGWAENKFGGAAQVLTPHGLVLLPLGGAGVAGIGVSSDGAMVVAVLQNNANNGSGTMPYRYDLTAWNTADGSIAWTKMLGIGMSLAGSAVRIVFSGDGSKIAYGGGISYLQSSLVTAATGTTLGNFSGTPSAFAADGLGFVGNAPDGLVIWSAANAAVSVRYPSSLPAFIGLGFGSDYTLQAIGQQNSTSPPSPDLFQQYVIPAGSAGSVVGSVPALLASGSVWGGMALAPDGKVAISVIGAKAFLWDVPTESLRLTFDVRTYSTPVFSPDGSLIAYGIDGDMTAIARTSAPATALATVMNATRLAVFSPDGRKLATVAGTMGRIWSLDPATIGQPLQTLWGNPATGHTDGISALAFTADSATVATAGADRLIKLWRVSDGGLIKNLAIPTTASLSSLLFTSDGTRIIGAGDTYFNAIYAWDIASGAMQMATLVPTNKHASPIFSAGRDSVLVSVPDQILRFATADLTPLAPIAFPGNWRPLQLSDDGRTIMTSYEPALVLWCAQ